MPDTSTGSHQDSRAPVRVAGPVRRQMLLDAARMAFADRGFAGSSTASIAAAAGCSEAVLYRHFPSKVDLLAAVFEQGSVRLRERVATLSAAVPDPLERLKALVTGIAVQPDGREMLRLLVLTIGVAGKPEIKEALLESFGAVRRMLTAIVSEGQQKGVIRDDLTAEDIAWMWQGLAVAGGLRLSVNGDEVRETVTSATDALASLVATRR